MRTAQEIREYQESILPIFEVMEQKRRDELINRILHNIDCLIMAVEKNPNNKCCYIDENDELFVDIYINYDKVSRKLLELGYAITSDHVPYLKRYKISWN